MQCRYPEDCRYPETCSEDEFTTDPDRERLGDLERKLRALTLEVATHATMQRLEKRIQLLEVRLEVCLNAHESREHES